MEDRLAIFFMKVKLGLTFAALGALFNIHCSDCKPVLVQILDIVYARTTGWIILAPNSQLKRHFRPHLRLSYSETRVILDCTELKVKCPDPTSSGSVYFITIPLHD